MIVLLSRWGYVKLFFGLLLVVSLSACSVTMNPVKRKPLEIQPLNARLPFCSQKIQVRLEDALPGKPLTETVWDNVTGAFWDVEESKQIGFTQNYSKLVAAGAAAGVVGGAIGGAVLGVVAGPKLVDTRIVIPFGRVFGSVFQSGLESAFPNSIVCYEMRCESQTVQAAGSKYLVKVKVTDFKVWENPLNHINLSATVVSKICPADRPDGAEVVQEVHREATNQSIGSIMSTSSGFIAEMNKITNRFAESLSTEVIDNLQRKCSE